MLRSGMTIGELLEHVRAMGEPHARFVQGTIRLLSKDEDGPTKREKYLGRPLDRVAFEMAETGLAYLNGDGLLSSDDVSVLQADLQKLEEEWRALLAQ